jgi:hypothetical protein
MKVVSTEALTKLIQLVKSAFVSKTDVVTTSEVTLTDVALSGDYDDLINKPTIPTVNDATLTIQKNGSNVATFTANASSNVTANIEVPTVDQTYSASSTNAQSGVAVASAISTKADSSTVSDINSRVTTIESEIPAQASSSNQLADKNFVNSSIATNTATFIGTFNSMAELEAYSGQKDDNDYAFVVSTDAAGNTVYNRYKWNGTAWLFEYALNNSSFTANQWAAINSGITTGLVTAFNAKGALLDYSGTTLSLQDSGGNNLSQVTIKSTPDLDNKSISLNADDELQTIGVINQNDTTTAIKTWTGTRAQYDAIVTKDNNTLYNITDDNTADAYEAYTKAQVDRMFTTVDLDNLSNVGKQEIVNCVMPSTNQVNFSITTTGQTITMPNSGYLQVIAYGSKSTNSFIGLYGNVASMVVPYADNVDMRGFIPVSEGENVQVYFANATNIQVFLLKSRGVI